MLHDFSNLCPMCETTKVRAKTEDDGLLLLFRLVSVVATDVMNTDYVS